MVEEIEALGRRGKAIVADISQSVQVDEMVAEVIKDFGRIDILANNAGIMGHYTAGALDYAEEDWHNVMANNLTGPFFCARAVARKMVEKGEGGKIVSTSAIVGKVPSSGRIIAYSAAKAALINLTQTLALKLAPHQINVNAICPGTTASELQSGLPIRSEIRQFGISFEEATAKIFSKHLGLIPLGEVAQPEDQANAIAFLASKEADHITGVALNINGSVLMAP